MPRGIDAESGDRLSDTGRSRCPRTSTGFAYREYLARQGISAIGRPREAAVLAEAAGPGRSGSVRGAMLDGLNGIVPEPEAASVPT